MEDCSFTLLLYSYICLVSRRLNERSGYYIRAPHRRSARARGPPGPIIFFGVNLESVLNASISFAHSAAGFIVSPWLVLLAMNISHPVPSTVASISFSFLTTEDVRRISVKQVVNPVLLDELNRPNIGGLYDPALGPSDQKDM